MPFKDLEKRKEYNKTYHSSSSLNDERINNAIKKVKELFPDRKPGKKELCQTNSNCYKVLKTSGLIDKYCLSSKITKRNYDDIKSSIVNKYGNKKISHKELREWDRNIYQWLRYHKKLDDFCLDPEGTWNKGLDKYQDYRIMEMSRKLLGNQNGFKKGFNKDSINLSPYDNEEYFASQVVKHFGNIKPSLGELNNKNNTLYRKALEHPNYSKYYTRGRRNSKNNITKICSCGVEFKAEKSIICCDKCQSARSRVRIWCRNNIKIPDNQSCEICIEAKNPQPEVATVREHRDYSHKDKILFSCAGCNSRVQWSKELKRHADRVFSKKYGFKPDYNSVPVIIGLYQDNGKNMKYPCAICKEDNAVFVNDYSIFIETYCEKCKRYGNATPEKGEYIPTD